ncbi:hypothetical protein F971_00848 [Acinetobacter vivianii]|uniref:Uncharacterized protein n=1 Tax=Acinetobacter vivianii TaxID=1776742 RepID=N8V1X1_9GAMM|nr:hypothetical protein [Acinetobacter vivianii]ENU93590.1 hypothetical protein F971_00848 [Acinetobacter vivianii]
MENALIKFEFLDGDYYKFNDTLYEYNDISSLKSNIGGIYKYLYSKLPENASVDKDFYAGREVIYAIIDFMGENLGNKKVIVVDILKDVLNCYVKIMHNFNQNNNFSIILEGAQEVDLMLFDIVNNKFPQDYKFKYFFLMAGNSCEFKDLNYELSIEKNKLKKELSEAKKELESFKNTKKNKPAVQLYHEINQDFLILEKRYRRFFISIIILTLVLTIGYDPLLGIGGNFLSLACSLNSSWIDACATLSKPSLYPFNGDTLKFVMFKLTVLIVGVTLTTYFLRLSGFYQLKQEQAKQTKLELSAFPDFVSGMDPSVANNLRQELALKYFGKEIDKTMIEKNGDLFQEQIKAGTDLIKASAEMVKTVKPSTAKEEDSEAKDKNKTE